MSRYDLGVVLLKSTATQPIPDLPKTHAELHEAASGQKRILGERHPNTVKSAECLRKSAEQLEMVTDTDQIRDLNGCMKVLSLEVSPGDPGDFVVAAGVSKMTHTTKGVASAAVRVFAEMIAAGVVGQATDRPALQIGRIGSRPSVSTSGKPDADTILLAQDVAETVGTDGLAKNVFVCCGGSPREYLKAVIDVNS